MALDMFDKSIFDIVNARAKSLETNLSADVVFYNGRIAPAFFRNFRDFIEEVSEASDLEHNAIAVFLRTVGGSAETAERMVNVLRKHYDHV